jgi:phage FluMu protein Com
MIILDLVCLECGGEWKDRYISKECPYCKQINSVAGRPPQVKESEDE